LQIRIVAVSSHVAIFATLLLLGGGSQTSVRTPRDTVESMPREAAPALTLVELRVAPKKHLGPNRVAAARIAGIAEVKPTLFVLHVIQSSPAGEILGYDRNGVSVIVLNTAVGRKIQANARLSDKYDQELLVNVRKLPEAIGTGYVAVVGYVRWLDSEGRVLDEAISETE
jgi:hypothetical protein